MKSKKTIKAQKDKEYIDKAKASEKAISEKYAAPKGAKMSYKKSKVIRKVA